MPIWMAAAQGALIAGLFCLVVFYGRRCGRAAAAASRDVLAAKDARIRELECEVELLRRRDDERLRSHSAALGEQLGGHVAFLERQLRESRDALTSSVRGGDAQRRRIAELEDKISRKESEMRNVERAIGGLWPQAAERHAAGPDGGPEE